MQSCKDAEEAERAAKPKMQRRKCRSIRERPTEVIRQHDGAAHARVAKNVSVMKSDRSRAALKAYQALQEATNYVNTLCPAKEIGNEYKLLKQGIRELESIYTEVS